LTYPCQFVVRVENKKPWVDSANVTINIAIKNLRTGQYVFMIKDIYNVTCNWTFSEEIQRTWNFKTMGRFYQSQFISLEVTVNGRNEDLPLYSTQRTVGVIVGFSMFLVPK
jgi:hypothetical protein